MEIAAETEGARTVLLAAPSKEKEICRELLETVADPDVLFVTYRRPASECFAGINNGVDTVSVITVGDEIASKHGDESTAPGDDVADATRAVPAPSNVTDLTAAIDQTVAGWDRPVICLDSVTELLQYVDFQTGFEFLQTVISAVHAADGRLHAHIDPGAHDGTTVAAITSLFDAKVSDATVQTRDLL
jgi:hypothetical protein